MTGFRRMLGWATWILCIGVVACGEHNFPDFQSIDHPIINGTPDTSPEHQAVVVIDLGMGLCTGTLIANDVILTADHCSRGVSPSSVDVGFGDKLSFGGTMVWRDVQEIRVHPNYNPGNSTTPPVNDIAMMRLSQAAPSSVMPIAHLPANNGISDLDLGVNLEYVGFGETESGGVGVRMMVTTDLEWICVESGGCVVDIMYPAAENTICQDQDPGGPCEGDSGGPALIDRGGIQYVAGVTSYGLSNGCTEFNCSTKVDAFESFINDFVEGELGSACSSRQDVRSRPSPHQHARPSRPGVGTLARC